MLLVGIAGKLGYKNQLTQCGCGVFLFPIKIRGGGGLRVKVLVFEIKLQPVCHYLVDRTAFVVVAAVVEAAVVVAVFVVAVAVVEAVVVAAFVVAFEVAGPVVAVGQVPVVLRHLRPHLVSFFQNNF